jgi:predicted nucleotidyltransferase component of viral defense system
MPFKIILQANNIEIVHVNEPKQTDTTQRWKISIKTPASDLPLHTKVEFSRRNVDDGILFETINSTILQQYNLSPIMLNHYSLEIAYIQKINALASRSQTQARDIFDLHLLLTRGAKTIKNKELAEHKAQAINNARSISFEDFKSQVLAYLPEDYFQQYNYKEAWENMVTKVVTALDNLE